MIGSSLFVNKLLNNWRAKHGLFDETAYVCYGIMVFDANPPMESLPGLLDITETLASSAVSFLQVRSEFLECMKQYPHIVKLVLSEIHRTTEWKAPDLLFLDTALYDLLASTILRPSSDDIVETRSFHMRFLEAGSIPAVLAAMTRMLRCDVSDKEELAHLLSTAGTYLQYCLRALELVYGVGIREKAKIQAGKRWIRSAGSYASTMNALVAYGEYGRIMFLGIIPDIDDDDSMFIHWGRSGKIGAFEYTGTSWYGRIAAALDLAE
ncbi:hypothetical protein C8J56DRAFT_1049808 [Mycena floridula]|nr:hypothetical protein C8J56DRAFT_1049808 [Mycena floridula]